MLPILGTLLYWSALYGLPACALVSVVGALVMYKRFRSVFPKIFMWSIVGMAIVVGGYGVLLLFLVFIAKDPAYQGQGLGIALAAPIIIAPIGAIVGGSIGFIKLFISKQR